jgi:multidrug efflux pump subunit AcrB
VGPSGVQALKGEQAFGGALFYGMASVIAFGLVVGTILTLGFVPVLYTLVFRIST